jgi:hypothetical protein
MKKTKMIVVEVKIRPKNENELHLIEAYNRLVERGEIKPVNGEDLIPEIKELRENMEMTNFKRCQDPIKALNIGQHKLKYDSLYEEFYSNPKNNFNDGVPVYDRDNNPYPHRLLFQSVLYYGKLSDWKFIVDDLLHTFLKTEISLLFGNFLICWPHQKNLKSYQIRDAKRKLIYVLDKGYRPDEAILGDPVRSLNKEITEIFKEYGIIK